MDIELEGVPYAARTTLRRMTELCDYDFSVFEGRDLNAQGLFGYRRLAQYWTDEDHHAFFIRADGKLAGFVLVRRVDDGDPPEADYSIAEFFVMRRYRRQGVGRRAAHLAFDRFPGRWLVHQIPQNAPAQAFWRKIIGEYTAGDFEDVPDGLVHGGSCPLQRFDNRQRASTEDRS
jgi:predicted acetyltransferase